ncbi:putative holin-like toxin [Lactovum odontotermitis]
MEVMLMTIFMSISPNIYERAKILSVYQALSLMIAFAILCVTIDRNNKK